MAKGPGCSGPNTLTTCQVHASTLLNLGRTEEAERAFRNLLPLNEKVNGPEHLSTLVSRHDHACALLNLGRIEEAESAFRKLLPLRAKVNGQEHSETLVTGRWLARSLLEQGISDRAAEILDALPIALQDQDDLDLARNAMLHGWLADLNGNAPKADALLSDAAAHLSDCPKDHYMRRELNRYLETRKPGKAGGTMIAEKYRPKR